jgi:hypothetical protein
MRKVLGIVVFSMLLLFVLPAAVFARANTGTKKIVTLPPNETVDHDYFAAGEIVEISGTVNGDVYVAGGQVLVDGIINGDLLAVGGVIFIPGTVTQNIRTAGGQVNISGNVGRNITVVGGNVDISSDASAVGSIVGAGGNFNLNAPIGKDAAIGAGNLNINSTVSRDLMAAVGTLRLSSNARVGGDITYWSEEDASIAESATILGNVEKKTSPKFTEPQASKKAMEGIGSFLKVTSLLSTLLIGIIMIRLYPNLSKRTVKTINEKAPTSLAAGFALIILTPILALLLMITVIGLPISLALLFIWGAFLYLGRIFVFIWGGRKVISYFRNKESMTLSLVIGALVYYALTILPFIGWVIKLAVVILGLGAFSLANKKAYNLSRKEKAI